MEITGAIPDIKIRISKEELIQKSSEFINDLEFVTLIQAVPDSFMVLNIYRQIVYANRSVLTLLNSNSMFDIVGLRPGEAFKCIRAQDAKYGCGSTEYCELCGAGKSITSALDNKSDNNECRIISNSETQAIDIKVWTTPLYHKGERFIIFSFADISHEKRRKALEHLFFHDILNIAGGLRGLTELLAEEDDPELRGIMFNVVNRLIDEIQAQYELTRAENNELKVMMSNKNSNDLLRELKTIYDNHQVTIGKYLEIASDSESIEFITDPKILIRVIGNMIKNALEASHQGEKVSYGCKTSGDDISFWVHNEAVMDKDVKLQVFQRSFSTKGATRGLGTHSIKLLTEKYLNGIVTFTSTEDSGTIFNVRFPIKNEVVEKI